MPIASSKPGRIAALLRPLTNVMYRKPGYTVQYSALRWSSLYSACSSHEQGIRCRDLPVKDDLRRNGPSALLLPTQTGHLRRADHRMSLDEFCLLVPCPLAGGIRA